jgi:TetR/AcrR family transcriptional regulator
MVKKRRAPQKDDGKTEKRILEAAKAVFIRHGTAGARMQDIAEEAGVNQALLHYYFRSKDRLAQAVFRDIAGRMVPSLVAVFGSESSIEQKVEQFVHLYIDVVRQSPFIPGYIVAELHFNPERLTALASEIAGAHPASVMQSFIPRLGAQLDEHVRIGAMRTISPAHFLVNLVALCVFPFLARPVLRIVFGQDDAAFSRFLDERREELPDFILNALRP